MGKVKALYDKGEHYDIVLFDMSGTINNPGVAKTVSLMDYIFIPVTADKIVLESSLAFAIKVRDEILTLPDSSIREMHMLWNKVDAREKTDLIEGFLFSHCLFGTAHKNGIRIDVKIVELLFYSRGE